MIRPSGEDPKQSELGNVFLSCWICTRQNQQMYTVRLLFVHKLHLDF